MEVLRVSVKKCLYGASVSSEEYSVVSDPDHPAGILCFVFFNVCIVVF